MNNRLRQYYEQELSFLREQGKTFSERFPKLAPFLGQGTKDPDIERLLEGFAFIGAKLSAKIDDAFPELAEQFLQILIPGYFSAMPSLCVLQFKPNPGLGKASGHIARGSEIKANYQNQPYFLTTCYDLSIAPIEIALVNKTVRQSQTCLDISFNLLYEKTTRDLSYSLRFYIHGNLRETYLISYLLTQKLKAVFVHIGEKKYSIPTALFKRMGLGANQNLMPYYEEYYHCFSLFSEYFIFPEKYMFLELIGLGGQALPTGKQFKIELVLDFDDRENLPITRDHFQLHSVPAVNLFQADAEPFTHQGEKIYYPLKVQNVKNAAVHSVLKVTGFSEDKNVGLEYLPAREFSVADQEILRYQEHMQESILQDHPKVLLELWTPKRILETQIISPHVLAYQPEAFLCINGIRLLNSKISNLGCEFTNLTPFTLPVYPPLSTEVVWQLIAQLAFKFKNLDDIQTLRELIITHNFASFGSSQNHALGKKLIENLLALRTIAQQHFYRGEILFGRHSTLEVKEEGFLNLGEIDVFGGILAQILREHAPFNSYHELEMKGVLTGFKLTWPTVFS